MGLESHKTGLKSLPPKKRFILNLLYHRYYLLPENTSISIYYEDEGYSILIQVADTRPSVSLI